MEKKPIEEMTKLYAGSNEVMKEYSEINTRAWQKLTKLELENMQLGLECTTRQWQIMGDAKTPADVLAAESNVFAEYSAKFLDNTRQIFETLTERQRDVMSCFTHNSMIPGLNVETKPGAKKAGAK